MFRGEGRSMSRSERFSRASGVSFNLGEFSSPIRAIVARIKELSRDSNGIDSYNHNNIAVQVDDGALMPSALFNTGVRNETLVVGRKSFTIRRVYLLGAATYKVAWVVDADISFCMICRGNFGWTRFRHHCRACGAVVCNNCSPYRTIIPQLVEEGGSRVCRSCFGLKPGAASALDISSSPTSSAGADAISPAFVSPNPNPSSKAASSSSSPVSASIGSSNSNNGSVNAKRSAMIPQQPLSPPKQSSNPNISSNPNTSNIRNNNNSNSNSNSLKEAFSAEKEKKKPVVEPVMTYEACYRRMRQLLPIDLQSRSSKKIMMEQGLPAEIAARIYTTKALWLICMHPDDIAMILLGDLRGKYQAYNLDILEMKAIWYNLVQVNWDFDDGSFPNIQEKQDWKIGFRNKLDDLELRELAKALLPSEKRNVVYQNHEKLAIFNPNIEIIPRRYRDNISERSSSSSFNQKFKQFDDTDDGNNSVNDDSASVGSARSGGIRRSSSLRSVPASAAAASSVGSGGGIMRQRSAVGFVGHNQNTHRISLGSSSNVYGNNSSSSIGNNTSNGASRFLISAASAESKPSPTTTAASSRLIGIFLAYVAAGEAEKARSLIYTSGCPRISPTEATALLVRCADNPDTLAQPLDTIALLVEELGADANAEDSRGKSVLQWLETDEHLACYLIEHGADALAGRDLASCPLYQSFEYGFDWMFRCFVSCLNDKKVLATGDTQKKLRYCYCLCFGGLYSEMLQIVKEHKLVFDEGITRELLSACDGNRDNMKQPKETIAYLKKLLGDFIEL